MSALLDSIVQEATVKVEQVGEAETASPTDAAG
jgi:hypothetical protein